MAFCQNCGQQADPGARFCTGCGAPLILDPPEAPEENSPLSVETAEAPADTAVPVIPVVSGAPEAPAAEPFTVPEAPAEQPRPLFAEPAAAPEAGPGYEAPKAQKQLRPVFLTGEAAKKARRRTKGAIWLFFIIMVALLLFTVGLAAVTALLVFMSQNGTMPPMYMQ